jgi:hypothetical protein
MDDDLKIVDVFEPPLYLNEDKNGNALLMIETNPKQDLDIWLSL